MRPGIALTIDSSAIDRALLSLHQIARFDPSALMEEIAALGESQTRRRITDEKTAPDGTPWAPNVEGTPILVETGRHLLGSVASSSSAEEAIWGASWEFAHVHQDGMVIQAKNGPRLSFVVGGRRVSVEKVTIPAREFVGLSDDNMGEHEDLVTDHMARLTR